MFLTVFLLLTINLTTFGTAATIGSILLIGIPAVWLLGELLMPLLPHRGLPTYSAKLEASVLADLSRTSPSDNMVQRLFSAITPILVTLIFFLIVAAFLAQGLGERAARDQKTYLVSNDYYTPCVVVAALSEGLLCVGFHPEAHTAIGEYRFIKPDGARVTLRETGPLKAATPILWEGTRPAS